MTVSERAVVIECNGLRMVGVLAHAQAEIAPVVLIVVGGPQYRAGSHRQFTLLARALGRAGISSLRFDYRGMGDSEGNRRTFDSVGADIRAAVDCLLFQVPQAREVVIWGLCDAASAAMMYAPCDERVVGLVLANPWVRTESGEARALLKHYYGRRLIDAELWHRIVHGQFNWRRALSELFESACALRRGSVEQTEKNLTGSGNVFDDSDKPLPERIVKALARFSGEILFVLSENDLTAQEFRDVANRMDPWRKLIQGPSVSVCSISGANHTFSSCEWRSSVEQHTVDWILRLTRTLEKTHA